MRGRCSEHPAATAAASPAHPGRGASKRLPRGGCVRAAPPRRRTSRACRPAVLPPPGSAAPGRRARAAPQPQCPTAPSAVSLRLALRVLPRAAVPPPSRLPCGAGARRPCRRAARRRVTPILRSRPTGRPVPGQPPRSSSTSPPPGRDWPATPSSQPPSARRRTAAPGRRRHPHRPPRYPAPGRNPRSPPVRSKHRLEFPRRRCTAVSAPCAALWSRTCRPTRARPSFTGLFRVGIQLQSQCLSTGLTGLSMANAACAAASPLILSHRPVAEPPQNSTGTPDAGPHSAHPSLRPSASRTCPKRSGGAVTPVVITTLITPYGGPAKAGGRCLFAPAGARQASEPRSAVALGGLCHFVPRPRSRRGAGNPVPVGGCHPSSARV